MMSALMCHDEITVCRICLGWLMARRELSMSRRRCRARHGRGGRFWETAGSDVEHYSDDFAFVHFGDRSVFDLDWIEDLDPATNHAGCYIITQEVDDWHARFVAAGL